MGPFSGARWARSQSAPPCPGAWSYRILGRFPLAASSVEKQQHQQSEQQARVPRAGPPKSIVQQPHPPGCCVHPQLQQLDHLPPVPIGLVNHTPTRSGPSQHQLSANTNYSIQSPYKQAQCTPAYPLQHPIREPPHVHPPYTSHDRPQSLHPEAHWPSAYPPLPPPGQHFQTPHGAPAGESETQGPGFAHSHSYAHCHHVHPQNDRDIQISHDQQHSRTQGAAVSRSHAPTWNAVNSQGPQAGFGVLVPNFPQRKKTASLEGQETLERPFIDRTPAEGSSSLSTSSGRPYNNLAIGNHTAGTSSQKKRHAEEQESLPISTNNTVASLHSAPKRTRKSYTREYKLKALNLLNGERPDGKGGMVPASDTWVSRQVGVTRKVLRGWKAQEERLRASRKGSRRVRVGRNRERRKPPESGNSKLGEDNGLEIGTGGPITGDDDISRHTLKSPQGSETSSEDGDAEIGNAGDHERPSTEDAHESGDDDRQQPPAMTCVIADG